MKRIVLAALALFPLSTEARQPPALHDKAWYISHPAERNKTLQICHSDATYSDLYDCQNAEAAATIADRPRAPSLNFMDDPAWWRANPVARDGVLVQCARRSPDDAPMLKYCAAAAAGR